jgi:putative redox protein
VSIDYTGYTKDERSSGTTPKQMFLQSIAGCTGMDVVNILTKMRSTLPENFLIDVQGDVADEEPAVFTNIVLIYHLNGQLDEKSVLKAVKLSQEKYCSISIMVKRICSFEYIILLNGIEVYREKNNLQ